jgi:hypothetical protein
VLEFPWKLIHLGESERYLFNITRPEGERINLIAEHPVIAARLEARFQTWSASLTPPGPPEKRHEQDIKFFADHVEADFAGASRAKKPRRLEQNSPKP